MFTALLTLAILALVSPQLIAAERQTRATPPTTEPRRNIDYNDLPPSRQHAPPTQSQPHEEAVASLDDGGGELPSSDTGLGGADAAATATSSDAHRSHRRRRRSSTAAVRKQRFKPSAKAPAESSNGRNDGRGGRGDGRGDGRPDADRPADRLHYERGYHSRPHGGSVEDGDGGGQALEDAIMEEKRRVYSAGLRADGAPPLDDNSAFSTDGEQRSDDMHDL